MYSSSPLQITVPYSIMNFIMMGSFIAQWIAFLLHTKENLECEYYDFYASCPAAPGFILGFHEIFSKKNMLLPRFIDSDALLREWTVQKLAS